jgi:starch synthase (maltosyl-transferring)
LDRDRHVSQVHPALAPAGPHGHQRHLLLPVTKISRAFRKGEIGCPYSAKSFFELEPDLHDRLLDGLPSAPGVDAEFGAFVEAAHALGIRIMVDLAPRTTSRDSDLILDHPEWLYWIDASLARGYGPPSVEGHKPGIPKPSQLADILSRDVIRSHIAKFRQSPSVTAPTRWKQFAKRCQTNPPRDLAHEIAREFGVITPPGFSDCMNDPQPPWSDVTFLRLYLDHPVASVRHLADPARQPPYVFTDTIKASKFPGRRPNRPLWKLLAEILPFYQKFGVDGARVDMGHALPPELQRMIIRRPKRTDTDFCFFAEELNHLAGAAAKRDGYNAFIGSAWHLEPRHATCELHNFIYNILPKAVLPSLAAAETPDSPRAATRDGGPVFARMISLLNNFLPSAIPFLNSGLELFERQPMNLGLDLQPPGRFALPKSDPYYGKMAYFDRVVLHWNNAGAKAMIDLLGRAAAIRQCFINDLVIPRNCFFPTILPVGRSVIAVGWRVDQGRRTLIVAASADFRRERRCVLSGLPTAAKRKKTCEALLEVHPSAKPPRLVKGKIRLTLPPGEVKILLL